MGTIDVSAGGRRNVTGLFTAAALTGDPQPPDITADTVQVSLGTSTTFGAWVTPTAVTHPTPGQVQADLLVDASTLPGVYILWFRVIHGLEVIDEPCRNETIRVI